MNLFNASFSLLILLSAAFAAKAEEIPFPFDVPMSVLEMERPIAGGSHQVLLSAPKRINNEIRYENRERLQGSGHEYLFWIENGYPVKSVHEYFLRWLKASGELLYSCEQRGCESSNVWANDVFKQPKLYGRDSDQYYLVGKYVLEGKQYWVFAYSVLNGRRHGYAYVSIFEAGVGGGDQIIQGQGFLSDSIETADFTVILEDLQRDATARWWLVGYGLMPVAGVSVADRLAAIKERSEQVYQALVKTNGFPAGRGKLHVAGPFNEPDARLKSDIWFKLYVQP